MLFSAHTPGILCFKTDLSPQAIATFSGVTRNHHDGKQVALLKYEAYHEMAAKQLLEICTNLRRNWSVHSIAVAHRTGVVGVTEVRCLHQLFDQMKAEGNLCLAADVNCVTVFWSHRPVLLLRYRRSTELNHLRCVIISCAQRLMHSADKSMALILSPMLRLFGSALMN